MAHRRRASRRGADASRLNAPARGEVDLEPQHSKARILPWPGAAQHGRGLQGWETLEPKGSGRPAEDRRFHRHGAEVRLTLSNPQRRASFPA
jgi:hypothetical protein